MPRPEFETVVAQAPKEKIVRNNIDDTTVLAAGGRLNIFVYSAPNTVSRFISGWLMYNVFNVVTVAPKLIVTYSGEAVLNVVNGNNDAKIEYNNSAPLNANTFNPNDLSAFILSMQSITITDVEPIKIQFRNDTAEADGGALKKVNFLMLEREVR
jgi:hypothetical protein